VARTWIAWQSWFAYSIGSKNLEVLVIIKLFMKFLMRGAVLKERSESYIYQESSMYESIRQKTSRYLRLENQSSSNIQQMLVFFFQLSHFVRESLHK